VVHHLSGHLRHSSDCAERCADGCRVRAFEEWIASPVLPSEIAAEKAEEQRFQALARGEFPE
jgi:hypothetical protein